MQLTFVGPQGGPQQGGYNNWNWGGPGPQGGGPGGPGPNGDMYGRGPNPTQNGGPPGTAAPPGPGVPGVKAEATQYGAGYGTNGYATVSLLPFQFRQVRILKFLHLTGC